jgi:PAS domain S-box-containing protein
MKSNRLGIIKKNLSSIREIDKSGQDEVISVEKRGISQALAQNTSDLVFHVQIKPVPKLIYVTSSCERITGYTPEEFYADPELRYKLVYPEDTELFINFINPGSDNTTKTALLRWIRKDGTVIWTENHRNIIRDEHGEPQSVYTVVRDITEQLKTQEAFKVLEDKFSRVFQASPNPICIISLADEAFVDINDAFTRFTGYSREEAIGRNSIELGLWVNKGDPDTMRNVLQQKGKMFNYEFATRIKSGEEKTALFSAEIVVIGGSLCIVLVITDITEQKRMEEALKESEEKYRTIFENINEVIIRTNKYGKITEINSRVEDLYGYKKEEVIGKHFAKLGILTPKDLPKAMKLFGDAVRGKITDYRGELESRDKAGNRIYIDINSKVVKKNGKPESSVTLISNVTERRKAQEALRKSEEKFSKVFAASLNPICIVTLEDAKFIDVNESFLRFTGYTREELIGHSGAELNLWAAEDDPCQAVKKFFEAGKLYNFEINSRRKSGELRAGLFSSNIIEIEGKLCLVTVITDITEQKWAEEALRESEEFTSSLLRNNPTPIFVTYPDTSIKYVNPAFEKLTGFALTDVIGMKMPYPWWPEETKEEIVARLKKSDFGNGEKKEMAYQKKNGERFWVVLSAAHVDQNGELKYIVVNWVDITERKQMEMALRESEEKFSLAFNTSPNVMSLTTLDGAFIEVNNSFLRSTGLTREQVIGRTSQELGIWVHPDDRGKLATVIRDKGRFTNEEFQFCNKSGKIETVLFSAEKISIVGKPCLITVINDITERKQMEDTLRFSDAAFQSIHESIIAVDNQNNVTYWNDMSEEIFGIEASEAIGKNFMDVMKPLEKHPGHQDELLQKLMKQGYNRDELQYATPHGEVWVDMTIQVIEKDNKRYGYVITASDITERKRAEKALQESQEKFSKAFSAASDAMAIIASDGGKFIEVNDNYVKLSGYSREELIGSDPDKLNMWADPEERQKILDKLFQTRILHNEEFAFRTKSGEIRTCLNSSESINIGGKRGIIVVVQDITERKKMEIALQESEEKFSKAFRASANAICITTMEDRRFLEANEAFSRFTGYSHDEVIGHNAAELNLWVHEEEKQKSLDTLDRDGRVYNREFSSRSKSGEIRVGLSSLEIITIRGKPYRMVAITDITERKKMEEALRESEEKFSKAFLASSNAIGIASFEDNRYIEVNDSFKRFTGYSREEIIGHNSQELGLWESEEALQQFRNKISEDGLFHNLEIRSRMKSGEIRVGIASADIINIGGKPFRMVAITDITERKKTEEALKESEEKFSKAFLTSPDAIAISTIEDGRFIDMNESFVKMMGYTRAEAIGHTSRELHLWPTAEERAKLMHILKEQGGVRNELFRFRKKSGEIGLGLFSAEYITLGNELCMISVNVDITEQKKAEERLRLLSSVTQQVTDSIIVTNPDLKITYMNKAAQNLFGYSVDEVLGTDVTRFNGVPITRKARQEMLKALSSGQTSYNVMLKRRKDGSTFLCDCRRSPLFQEDGKLASFIVVHRDITDQKEIEARLQAQKQLIESILASMPEGVLVTNSSDRVMLVNSSFRRIFQARRKVIENQPLNEIIRVEQLFDLYTSIKTGSTDNNSLEFRYKIKNLEKIIDCAIIKMDNERMLLIFSDVSREREEEDKLYLMDRLASLGEMAAGLAHELNNPLTGILTLSQLLVNSDIPEEHKEDLECVYSEAKRAANIVKNVLLFTRNNSYENGRSSVNEVIKEVFRLREHEEKVNNVNVVTNLQGNLPEIQLDKYQLQQVFLNIILNAEAAIQEMKRPGTITVTTERTNNHVTIKFSDDGCGIKKHILPRIFDPFFTTKEIGKGTGLGLSICYGIIVKHNGKISVKTQVGKGTTFTIKLPIANEFRTPVVEKGE